MGHFVRDYPIPREDERNLLVEAVTKTVTSGFPQDQSQCVVEINPTDQLRFISDKSVSSLGSGAVEMDVAPSLSVCIDKTICQHQALCNTYTYIQSLQNVKTPK